MRISHGRFATWGRPRVLLCNLHPEATRPGPASREPCQQPVPLGSGEEVPLSCPQGVSDLRLRDTAAGCPRGWRGHVAAWPCARRHLCDCMTSLPAGVPPPQLWQLRQVWSPCETGIPMVSISHWDPVTIRRLTAG